MKTIKEMKKEAYQFVKDCLANRVFYENVFLRTKSEIDNELAAEFLKKYITASDMYEQIFDEEFLLTDEDRDKIFG